MTDVRRPQAYYDMMADLKGPRGAFDTYKECLVFCACVGFAQGKRVEFDKSAEPVPISIFRGEFDDAIFHAIALAATDDPTIMSNEREPERVRLFEEYACGGLEVLKQRVYDGPDDYSEALLKLVSENLERRESDFLDDITRLLD